MQTAPTSSKTLLLFKTRFDTECLELPPAHISLRDRAPSALEMALTPIEAVCCHTTDLETCLLGLKHISGGSYKVVDRQPDQLYQKLRQRLEPDRKRKLKTAEFAWIAFRDSACSFEASGSGNATRNQCLTRLTNQRNQQLQDYLVVDR